MFFITFYRLFFFTSTVLVGRLLFIQLGVPHFRATLIAVIISLIFGGIEHIIAKKKPREVLTALTGLATTLLISSIVAFIITRAESVKPASIWVYLLSNLVGLWVIGGYIYKRRDKLTFLDIFIKTQPTSSNYKVIDTSALIDARIKDVAESGFLEGTLLVPRFVLRELQRIADSKEHVRRTKGRRGMDVLKALQRLSNVSVILYPEEYPEVRGVDQKLIKLCRKQNAKLITVDFNLKKSAEVEGVHVLNVNELALALKPPYGPGEEIQVKITKTGKEPGQGVGYLDDGTMVVVDNGESLIGSTITCTIQHFHQTATGRIIFAKPKRS